MKTPRSAALAFSWWTAPGRVAVFTHALASRTFLPPHRRQSAVESTSSIAGFPFRNAEFWC